MKKEILRMENITVEEGGENYLDNLKFYILQGEIMGLIVSEERGKKQLIELICSNQPISYGRVYFQGKLVNHYAYSDMSENRVYVIEERGRLIESLTVSDNLFVMRKGFKKYLINTRILDSQAERLMQEMGVSINPGQTISSLRSLERCVVELLKATLMGCSLIILDRVSNFLSQMELKRFQEIVRFQSQNGMSFLYVGNHHQEVFQIADRAALFHQGMVWKVFEKAEMTDEKLEPYTISFDLSESQRIALQQKTVLVFDEVIIKQEKPLSFTLNKGECLMVLDRDNQMWESLAQLFSGECGMNHGTITLDHTVLKGTEPKDFFSKGIAVIPDDPASRFLFWDMSYLENLTFLLDRKVPFGNVRRSYLKSVRREYKEKVGTCIDEQQLRKLSTKERYGLSYYRIHLLHPKVAVCVQPLAKGDMYCRRYVLDLIQELKNSGISVLILTSNLSDNMDVSDRMLVLKNGELIAEYLKEEFYKLGW